MSYVVHILDNIILQDLAGQPLYIQDFWSRLEREQHCHRHAVSWPTFLQALLPLFGVMPNNFDKFLPIQQDSGEAISYKYNDGISWLQQGFGCLKLCLLSDWVEGSEPTRVTSHRYIQVFSTFRSSTATDWLSWMVHFMHCVSAKFFFGDMRPDAIQTVYATLSPGKFIVRTSSAATPRTPVLPIPCIKLLPVGLTQLTIRLSEEPGFHDWDPKLFDHLHALTGLKLELSESITTPWLSSLPICLKTLSIHGLSTFTLQDLQSISRLTRLIELDISSAKFPDPIGDLFESLPRKLESLSLHASYTEDAKESSNTVEPTSHQMESLPPFLNPRSFHIHLHEYRCHGFLRDRILKRQKKLENKPSSSCSTM